MARKRIDLRQNVCVSKGRSQRGGVIGVHLFRKTPLQLSILIVDLMVNSRRLLEICDKGIPALLLPYGPASVPLLQSDCQFFQLGMTANL